MSENTNSKEYSIETEELTCKYGGFIAVDKLSIAIHKSEILILLGPNGAGKTTFIRTICGLRRSDGGTVKIFGEIYNGLNSNKRFEIGYCPQTVTVWNDLTCLEQLYLMADMYGLPTSESRRFAKELIERLGLQEKADVYAGRLSGGMARRLNLAMTLIHDPEILILDEVAVGLDPCTRLMVRSLIRDLSKKEGKTVIISTHDIDEAERLADRCAIMDNGRLLRLDTPSSLKESGHINGILELIFSRSDEAEIKNIYSLLCDAVDDVILMGEAILVKNGRESGVADRVKDLFARNGVEPVETRVRDCSLEDIFIKLTGRRMGA